MYAYYTLVHQFLPPWARRPLHPRRGSWFCRPKQRCIPLRGRRCDPRPGSGEEPQGRVPNSTAVAAHLQTPEGRPMPPELKPFFIYWSLTFAVLFFYIFAFIVAGLDIWAHIMDLVRKRRSQLVPAGPALDPNPLKGKTVAETLGPGPGQQPDEKRQWVLDRATEAATKLGLAVRIVV